MDDKNANLKTDNINQFMSRNGKTDCESLMFEHDNKDQFMSPNGKTDSESSMLEHDNKDQFMSPNGKTDSESLMFEHDNKGQIMSRIVGTVFHRYLLVQLLIFVMLLILNSMTGYYLNNEPETYQQDSTDLCLPCLDLKCHADESYEGIVKRDDGMCCARNGQNISTVISQYTTRWYKMKLEEEDPHFHYCRNNNEEQESHASLKLVGPYVEQGEVSNSMLLVSWNQTEPPGSEGNGLQYREGYIRIPETALYYVYTQLALKDRKTGSYDMLIFSHVVVQQSASSGDEESILNSCNTPDPCEGEISDQQSSYLGSYMMLKEGDKIAVKVGGGPGIIKESEMNFFGVYKA